MSSTMSARSPLNSVLSSTGADSTISKGSCERKYAAVPELAVQVDALAAQQAYQAGRDRQAEARAADAVRVLELGEGLEDCRVMAGCDAWPRVGDTEVQAALAAVRQVVDADADLDLALLGVLDRVGKQVAEHLPQAQRVADHDRGHAGFDLADSARSSWSRRARR